MAAFNLLTHGSTQDLHERKYSDLGRLGNFSSVETIVDGTRHGLPLNQHNCPYSLHVYPTVEFESAHRTSTPGYVTVAVVLVFVFAGEYRPKQNPFLT